MRAMTALKVILNAQQSSARAPALRAPARAVFGQSSDKVAMIARLRSFAGFDNLGRCRTAT